MCRFYGMITLLLAHGLLHLMQLPKFYNHIIEIFCWFFVGYYHSLTVTSCSCESEAETLLKAFLFPATPKHPHLVFSFSLLDWLEALMLEFHVSAKDLLML